MTTKHTLGSFGKQVIGKKCFQHSPQVNQMSLKVWTENKDVIKKKKKKKKKHTKTIFLKYGLKIVFIRAWKVDGAFVNPKGITRNL